ncbi:MAG: hypothetical protein KDI92_10530 [Xanthomonadales bacterium]|nr:hypothetical protein [Xanthomonadales bacterium]
MFSSETEGTGIKSSETEGTGMTFSESEGTDIATDKVSGKFFKNILKYSWLLIIGQIAVAEVGYIHETKNDGIYEGMIVDNVGNNVLFEGIIENNELTGFITKIEKVGLTDSVDDGTGGATDSVDDGTGGATDSVDDGTGGATDSVDDGTGGALDSVDDGTGKLLSIQLACDLNNHFEVSVENESSDATMINFVLTSLYFNGSALTCSN